MRNKLVTSLYRKKTFGGVYLNYNSFLPLNYKKGIIHTLLFLAFNTCSYYNAFHNEVQHSNSIWQKNSFLPFLLRSNDF